MRGSRLQLMLTLGWLGMIAPTLLWWRDSILWIAFMSIWANVATHFDAYLSARGHEDAAEAEASDS